MWYDILWYGHIKYSIVWYDVALYGAYVEFVPGLGWGLGAVGQWTQPPSTEYSIPSFKKKVGDPQPKNDCLSIFEQSHLKSRAMFERRKKLDTSLFRWKRLRMANMAKVIKSWLFLESQKEGNMRGNLGLDPKLNFPFWKLFLLQRNKHCTRREINVYWPEHLKNFEMWQ